MGRQNAKTMKWINNIQTNVLATSHPQRRIGWLRMGWSPIYNLAWVLNKSTVCLAMQLPLSNMPTELFFSTLQVICMRTFWSLNIIVPWYATGANARFQVPRSFLRFKNSKTSKHGAKATTTIHYYHYCCCCHHSSILSSAWERRSWSAINADGSPLPKANPVVILTRHRLRAQQPIQPANDSPLFSSCLW